NCCDTNPAFDAVTTQLPGGRSRSSNEPLGSVIVSRLFPSEVTARTSAPRRGVLLSTAMTRPRIAAVASNGCWRMSRDWGQATGVSARDSPRSATTTLLTAREVDIFHSVAYSLAVVFVKA